MKIIFSVFLLIVFGLVITAPVQAVKKPIFSTQLYHYIYPYFSFNNDISNNKVADNFSSIRIPKISELTSRFK